MIGARLLVTCHMLCESTSRRGLLQEPLNEQHEVINMRTRHKMVRTGHDRLPFTLLHVMHADAVYMDYFCCSKYTPRVSSIYSCARYFTCQRCQFGFTPIEEHPEKGDSHEVKPCHDDKGCAEIPAVHQASAQKASQTG